MQSTPCFVSSSLASLIVQLIVVVSSIVRETVCLYAALVSRSAKDDCLGDVDRVYIRRRVSGGPQIRFPQDAALSAQSRISIYYASI